MSDELDDIFTTHLPGVAEGKRRAFLDGMRAYHAKFKEYREEHMVYETGEQYQNYMAEIVVLDPEDFWVYAPHFCRVFGLVLNKLFKTKISFLSTPAIGSYERGMLFVDANKFRWSSMITPSVSEPGRLRICVRFPRSDTKFCVHQLASENDISQKESTVIAIVTSVSDWYEP